MGVKVERVRPGEEIQIRKDPDGISVWLMDRPLIQRATPIAAVAAIREHFGQVDSRILNYLKAS